MGRCELHGTKALNKNRENVIFAQYFGCGFHPVEFFEISRKFLL